MGVLLRVIAAVMLTLSTGFVTALASSSAAYAHTCGTTGWCSGDDSLTVQNTQGNDPQIYAGEAGEYDVEFGTSSYPCPSGVGGYCYRASAANAAQTRYNNSTGMGNVFYYLLGGPDSSLKPSGTSNYCWGWRQGKNATHLADTNLTSWYNSTYLFAADIEQNGTFKWAYHGGQANRDVINGFRDWINGKTSADSGCSGFDGDFYEFAVYSAPAMWSYMFGGASSGNIPYLPEWTYENCCTSAWPGSFSGGSGANWFGGSQYPTMWQFDINPDYDILNEPLYLPNLRITIGN